MSGDASTRGGQAAPAEDLEDRVQRLLESLDASIEELEDSTRAAQAEPEQPDPDAAVDDAGDATGRAAAFRDDEPPITEAPAEASPGTPAERQGEGIDEADAEAGSDPNEYAGVDKDETSPETEQRHNSPPDDAPMSPGGAPAQHAPTAAEGEPSRVSTNADPIADLEAEIDSGRHEPPPGDASAAEPSTATDAEPDADATPASSPAALDDLDAELANISDPDPESEFTDPFAADPSDPDESSTDAEQPKAGSPDAPEQDASDQPAPAADAQADHARASDGKPDAAADTGADASGGASDEPAHQHPHDEPEPSEPASAGPGWLDRLRAHAAACRTEYPAPPDLRATGRWKALIVAWRLIRWAARPTAIVLWRIAALLVRASRRHGGPMAAGAFELAASPLEKKPPSVRSAVGWIAVYTLFIAGSLWAYLVFFRDTSPPPPTEGLVRIIENEQPIDARPPNPTAGDDAPGP